MSDQAQIALVNMPFSYDKVPVDPTRHALQAAQIQRDSRRLSPFERPLCPPDVELHESICEKRSSASGSSPLCCSGRTRSARSIRRSLSRSSSRSCRRVGSRSAVSLLLKSPELRDSL